MNIQVKLFIALASLSLVSAKSYASEIIRFSVRTGSVVCETGATGALCRDQSDEIRQIQIVLENNAGQMMGNETVESGFGDYIFQYVINAVEQPRPEGSRYVVGVFANVYGKSKALVANYFFGSMIFASGITNVSSTFLGEKIDLNSSSSMKPSLELQPVR